ncbi:MAG: hypothetical protein WCH01_20880 [Methylococcaceae bacterium]
MSWSVVLKQNKLISAGCTEQSEAHPALEANRRDIRATKSWIQQAPSRLIANGYTGRLKAFSSSVCQDWINTDMPALYCVPS